MIDITTIEPNQIPPKIEFLQNENAQLIIENELMDKQTKLIATAALVLIVISSVIFFNLNNNENEKRKNIR